MSRGRFRALSIILDAVLFNAGIVLAFLIQFEWQLPRFNFLAYLIIAPFATLFFLGSAWANGLYDAERTDTAWSLARSTLFSLFLGMLFMAALLFLGGQRTVSFARKAFIYSWPIDFVLLVGWRLLFLHFGQIRWPEQRVVIVGTGHTATDLANELTARAQWGWRVVGLLDATVECTPGAPREVNGIPVLGCASDVARIARETDADRIIVVSPVALRELVESLVLADELQVRVDVVPELYEIFIGSVDALVGDIPLMRITGSTVPAYFASLKRVTDVLTAALLLIVLSPVLLLAMLAIAIEDGLPVIFRQQRVGRDLKPFNVLKLRTMVKDAEKLSGPVLAEEDDPRITRTGRVLRTYRIDELPQLVNIMRGEMSFVGPRPERPFFVEQHLADIPGYRERFRVKPGVTGLAQVSGGYATTPERKLKYDLIYMYHQSFAMDVQIVADTLRVVMTGRGAR